MIGANDGLNRNRFGFDSTEALISLLKFNCLVSNINIANVQLGSRGFKMLFQFYYDYSQQQIQHQAQLKHRIDNKIESLEHQIKEAKESTAELRVALKDKIYEKRTFRPKKIIKMGLQFLDLANNEISIEANFAPMF